MANPKKKHSPSRRDMRRAANWKLEPCNLNKCPQCGSPKIPHRVCNSCGFYNGELIVPKKEKKKTTDTQEGQK